MALALIMAATGFAGCLIGEPPKNEVRVLGYGGEYTWGATEDWRPALSLEGPAYLEADAVADEGFLYSLIIGHAFDSDVLFRPTTLDVHEEWNHVNGPWQVGHEDLRATKANITAGGLARITGGVGLLGALGDEPRLWSADLYVTRPEGPGQPEMRLVATALDNTTGLFAYPLLEVDDETVLSSQRHLTQQAFYPRGRITFTFELVEMEGALHGGPVTFRVESPSARDVGSVTLSPLESLQAELDVDESEVGAYRVHVESDTSATAYRVEAVYSMDEVVLQFRWPTLLIGQEAIDQAATFSDYYRNLVNEARDEPVERF